MAKKTKVNKFKGKVGADAAKQQEGRSYGYLKIAKGVNIFKPEASKVSVLLDIIPYTVTDEKHPDRDDKLGIALPGDLWYKRPFKIHRNIGVNNEAVVCLSSIGKKCPICEYRAKRTKEGAEKEELDALRPSDRVLYNVIPRGHKSYEEVVHLWDMSYALFQKLLKEELAENEQYEGFPDLADGNSLKVRFGEEKLGKNTFVEAKKITFEQRDEIDEEVLEEVSDLDSVLKILSYKELDKLFFDMDDDADEDDEEDDDPKKSKKSSASSKPTTSKTKLKTVEEDEDEEDEEEDEDEEEEVAPKRNKKAATPPPAKKSSKHVVEEDEDDDEDEEEEEDEEEDEEEVAPKKVARKTVTPPAKKSSKPVVEEDDEDEDEEDEDEDEEEVAPKKGKKATPPPPPVTKGKKKTLEPGVCPSGKVFGKDCDKYDECEDCPLWDSCAEAQEKLKTSKKR